MYSAKKPRFRGAFGLEPAGDQFPALVKGHVRENGAAPVRVAHRVPLRAHIREGATLGERESLAGGRGHSDSVPRGIEPVGTSRALGFRDNGGEKLGLAAHGRLGWGVD